MVLYIFISHQKNIDNSYHRIKNMMNNDFIVVTGGHMKDEYDPETRILKLNCNDGYIGLTEKVIKTFHFILSNDYFDSYSTFIKLDDDMNVVKFIDYNAISGFDYFGIVCEYPTQDGYNRTWHMGKTGTCWDNIPYLGEYKPFCLGGYGYGVSRRALSLVLPNFDYVTNIYEDVNMGLLMYKYGIYPTNITNIMQHLQSAEHTSIANTNLL